MDNDVEKVFETSIFETVRKMKCTYSRVPNNRVLHASVILQNPTLHAFIKHLHGHREPRVVPRFGNFFQILL